MIDNIYNNMLVRLRAMDEIQFLELFHDIDDEKVLERMISCAFYFLCKWDAPENNIDFNKLFPSVAKLNEITREELDNLPKPIIQKGAVIQCSTISQPNTLGVNYDEEHKQADDTQRHREHQENERRPY